MKNSKAAVPARGDDSTAPRGDSIPPDRPGEPPRPGPLAGIRVLDLTRALSGPFATMILGDLGADVIKVEDVWHGDDTRRWGPPFQGDDAAYFLSINRNKRGLSVNLKTREGRQIVQDLAGRADLLM